MVRKRIVGQQEHKNFRSRCSRSFRRIPQVWILAKMSFCCSIVQSREQALFVGPSFDTISSIGPNGAIIHYKPHKETCSVLDTKQVYLCDSGGQYKYAWSLIYVNFAKSIYVEMEPQTLLEPFTLVNHLILNAIVLPVFSKATSIYHPRYFPLVLRGTNWT